MKIDSRSPGCTLYLKESQVLAEGFHFAEKTKNKNSMLKFQFYIAFLLQQLNGKLHKDFHKSNTTIRIQL